MITCVLTAYQSGCFSKCVGLSLWMHQLEKSFALNVLCNIFKAIIVQKCSVAIFLQNLIIRSSKFVQMY